MRTLGKSLLILLCLAAPSAAEQRFSLGITNAAQLGFDPGVSLSLEATQGKDWRLRENVRANYEPKHGAENGYTYKARVDMERHYHNLFVGIGGSHDGYKSVFKGGDVWAKSQTSLSFSTGLELRGLFLRASYQTGAQQKSYELDGHWNFSRHWGFLFDVIRVEFGQKQTGIAVTEAISYIF